MTDNWSTRESCRGCGVVVWPLLAAVKNKKKSAGGNGTNALGGAAVKMTSTKVTPVKACATAPVVKCTAVEESEPKGEPSVAQLRQELAKLEASLKVFNGGGASEVEESLETNAVQALIRQNIEAVKAKIRDQRPVTERLEGLRGAIQRGRNRLKAAEAELNEVQMRIAAEKEILTKREAEMATLEHELMAEVANRNKFQSFREMEEQHVPP